MFFLPGEIFKAICTTKINQMVHDVTACERRLVPQQQFPHWHCLWLFLHHSQAGVLQLWFKFCIGCQSFQASMHRPFVVWWLFHPMALANWVWTHRHPCLWCLWTLGIDCPVPFPLISPSRLEHVDLDGCVAPAGWVTSSVVHPRCSLPWVLLRWWL